MLYILVPLAALPASALKTFPIADIDTDVDVKTSLLNGWDILSNNNICGVGVGVQSINCARGRRLANAEAGFAFSNLVNMAANVDICAATTSHFRENLLEQFVNTLIAPGGNADGMGSIAENMGDWCLEMENRRRLESVDGEGIDDQWQHYADGVLERAADAQRRMAITSTTGWMIDSGMASGDDLPYNAYQQCRGYATAMAHTIGYTRRLDQATADQLVAEGAGDIYSVSANGEGTEQIQGCATVVNTVNDAVSNGKIDGLEVIEHEGTEVVIVTDSNLLNSIGGALTAVVLASGGIVYKLFDVCRHFEDIL